MAVLKARTALDMHDWNLGNPAEGTLGGHDDVHFDYAGDGGRVYTFGGEDFEYFTHGSFTAPFDGEIQSLTISDAGEEVYALSGISIHVLAAAGLFITDQIGWFHALVLHGDDTVKGSRFGDVLDGFWGNDHIRGLRGADFLEGGLGADVLRGGRGADTFGYDYALQSTGVDHDTVVRFNAARDSFQFPDAVAAIDAAVTTGTASDATFDDDLAAALDAAHLGAGNAVLFTPDSGDRAGHTFLVVNMNGDAGYQACEDAVIWLRNAVHMDEFGVGNFVTG